MAKSAQKPVAPITGGKPSQGRGDPGAPKGNHTDAISTGKTGSNKNPVH